MKRNQMNLLLLVGVFVLIVGVCGQLDGKPTTEERKICDDNKGDRRLESVIKTRRLSCKITCNYIDGTNKEEEEYNSPDGQMCCPMGGVGPTGICRNGDCPMGGMINMPQ